MKTISDHITDIIQNSTRAGADEIRLLVDHATRPEMLVVEIQDNGPGIDPEILLNITDPFTTTRKTRKVGMGLPLLVHHARLAGGEVVVESKLLDGTRVVAEFQLSSIDRQPLGDIGAAVTLLITGSPGVNLIFQYISPSGSYEISTHDITDSIDGDDIGNPKLFRLIRELITSNVEELGSLSV
jgi:hypothetical protein